MRNGIDPVAIFEDYELELVLKRNNIPVPDKDCHQPEYVKKLIDVSDATFALSSFRLSFWPFFERLSCCCPEDDRQSD